MLDDCETWAVIGLSGDPERTAYRIAALLQSRGKRIVPIHPSAATVLGEQGYAALSDVPFAIDVVDVFRRSEFAGEFADQAVAIGARGVWFQLGVIDEDAFATHSGCGSPDGDGHLPGHRVAPSLRDRKLRRVLVGLIALAVFAAVAVVINLGWARYERHRTVEPTTALDDQCDEVPDATERVTLTGADGFTLGAALSAQRTRRSAWFCVRARPRRSVSGCRGPVRWPRRQGLGCCCSTDVDGARVPARAT